MACWRKLTSQLVYLNCVISDNGTEEENIFYGVVRKSFIYSCKSIMQLHFFIIVFKKIFDIFSCWKCIIEHMFGYM